MCAISSLTSTFAISSPDEFLLCTTSRFHIRGKWNRIKHDVVSSSSPDGGTGDEVAVDSRRLVLKLPVRYRVYGRISSRELKLI